MSAPEGEPRIIFSFQVVQKKVNINQWIPMDLQQVYGQDDDFSLQYPEGLCPWRLGLRGAGDWQGDHGERDRLAGHQRITADGEKVPGYPEVAHKGRSLAGCESHRAHRTFRTI